MWSLVYKRTNRLALSRKVEKILGASKSPVAPAPVPSSTTTFSPQSSFSLNFYTSRAHPRPIPEFTVMDAVDTILTGVEERKMKREQKWERNKEQRQKKGLIDDEGGFRNQDETIELALNLNLDPRKPNQNIRGSIALPHGSGKKLQCVVFTSNEEIAKRALEQGAVHAGGQELMDKIVAGEIPLDFDRCLATVDMQKPLSKSLARVLGPRGLMPNTKVGTLLNTPDELLEALNSQLTGGPVQFRTDKTGIVHLGVGKGSFGKDKLLDNVRTVMSEIFNNKPEGNIGKKKATKNAKYLLRAHLTATHGKGSVRLDLRTVDPTSAFFMSNPEV